jgi:hypothetical protein
MQHHDPATFRRRDRFERLVSLFERDEIEAAVDALIAYMDAHTPDADLEPDGDERDGNSSEDDFMWHGGFGPGCRVSDPDEDDDEDCCRAGEDDAAMFSRGAQMGFAGDCALSDPDAEAAGDEQDGSASEDEFMRHDCNGPGCPLSDPGGLVQAAYE